MNDGDCFRALIKANPEDRIGVKVYADFLMEYVGYERFAALRRAAEVRRGPLLDLFMRQAEELFKEGSPFTETCWELINHEVPTRFLGGVAVSLTSRVHAPYLVDALNLRASEPDYIRCVAVSTRWLLRRLAWKELLDDVLQSYHVV